MSAKPGSLGRFADVDVGAGKQDFFGITVLIVHLELEAVQVSIFTRYNTFAGRPLSKRSSCLESLGLGWVGDDKIARPTEEGWVSGTRSRR